MSVAEQILRYFDARPDGKQRVPAKKLHTELRQAAAGAKDTSDRALVSRWAAAHGLHENAEGGTALSPNFYTFTKSA